MNNNLNKILARKTNILIIANIACLMIFASSVQASHIMGGEITYTCVSNNNYQITLKLYRDCSGVTLGNSETLVANSISCGSQNISMTLVGSPTDITPLCASAPSACNGGGGSNGVEEYIYTGNLTTNSSCTDWTLSYSSCCRNSIFTFFNSG